MKRPLAIDLFSAGGGLLLAMLMAGFPVAGSVDINPVWADVILMNFCGPDRLLPHLPEVLPLTIDLLGATPQQVMAAIGRRVEELAWVHLSPPCQDHSYAGRRARHGKGHDCLLVPVAWANACKHAFITVENVVGVEDSERFPELIERLRQRGETYWLTVCASWFGVSQFRKRIWVIAAPAGARCPPLPAPTCSLDEPRNWSWAMSQPRSIDGVEDNRFRRPSTWQAILLPHVPPGGTSEDIGDPMLRDWMRDMYADSIQNFVRRLRTDRPVPAVLTDVSISNLLSHCHPFLHRTSTIREVARFQDFPDEFVFPAGLTNAYRMIGEAIPVGMGLAWARQIMRALGGDWKLSDGGILLPSRPDLSRDA